MIGAANIVHDIVGVRNGARQRGALWTIFSGIHKVHRMWRWYRRAEVYSNPDNFLKLAVGHGLNFVAGDKLVLQVAAQCVAISMRILKCFEQEDTLLQACSKWQDAIHGRYATPVKTKWVKKARALSPSTILWWKNKGKVLFERIKRITVCTLKIFQEAFVLSMRRLDAIELFSFSPETRKESINEIFVNVTELMEELVKKKEILLWNLEKNKKLIDRVLGETGSSFSSEELIKVVKQTIDKTEKVNNVTKKVSQTVGVIAKECLRKWTYEVVSEFVPQKHIPKELIPPIILPWEHVGNEKDTERFPPIEPNQVTTPPVVTHKRKKNLSSIQSLDIFSP